MTHTVVIGERLREAQPWVVPSLIEAFLEAHRAAATWSNADPKHLGFTNAIFLLEEERAAYAQGWEHGVANNRAALETFIRYAHAQGYIPRRYGVEELFPIDL